MTNQNKLRLLFIFFKTNIFPHPERKKAEKFRDEFCTKNNWLSAKEFQENSTLINTLPGSFTLNIAYLIGKRISGITGGFLALLGLLLPGLLLLELGETFLFYVNPEQYVYYWILISLRTVLVANILFNTFNLRLSELPLSTAFLVLGTLAISMATNYVSMIWFVITDLIILLFFSLHRLQEREGIIFLLVWLYLVASVNLSVFLFVTFLSGAAVTVFILKKEGKGDYYDSRTFKY